MSEFQKLDFSLVWYSFLALMQEKNQKKIKASGTPANFGLVHIRGAYIFSPLYIPIR